jgi:hypothetical protein
MPPRITVNFRRFDFQLEASSLELYLDQQELTEGLRFWTDQATVDLPQALGARGLGPGNHVILARVRDLAGAYHQVETIFQLLLYPCVGGCPWPFAPTDQPNVVSNLMEDWQDFCAAPYFHSGLDIRAPAGTSVHSCTDGTVVKVIQYKPSSLYWEVAVQDPQGWIWQYHHLDGGSITVSEGDPVSQGEVLGSVVTWSTAMNGFTYHHLHLNIVRWLGGGPVPGPYVDGFMHYNPLNFLIKGTPDAVLPTGFDVWFADNESVTPFAQDSDPGDPTLAGDVDIIAKLRDRRNVLAPANGQPYELGLYELSLGAVPIDTRCGMGLLPKTRLAKFDVMPGGTVVANQDAILKKIYKEELDQGSTTVASRYNYTTQQFFYTLTNVKNGHPDDVNGFWNTDATNFLGAIHPDGQYDVTVYAEDYYGNELTETVRVRLDNDLDYAGICPFFVDQVIWVHPLDLVSQQGDVAPSLPGPCPIDFGPVVDGSAHAQVDHQNWPVWTFDVSRSGLRVAIGLLQGRLARIEYVPLLGDVIFDVDAEVQVFPLGASTAAGSGVFDPAKPSTNPVRLRLSTRLARDPRTMQPHIGQPAAHGQTHFALVMAETIDVQGQTMLLRTRPGGSQVTWELSPLEVDPPRPPASAVALAISPNPARARATVTLDAEREVTLAVDVLDVRGRRVRQLHSGPIAAGRTVVSWDGADALGHRQPAGVYWVRATARDGASHAVKRFVLMR